MSLKYSIAETFGSIQGEGVWTGTPMFFIRLAGCNVGRYERPSDLVNEKREDLAALRLLNVEHSICTSSDGQRFLCDTDYRRHLDYSIDELVNIASPYEHICLTGGEPFMRNIEELILALQNHYKIHIETSGTRPLQGNENVWITCCPKAGFDRALINSPRINEWKLLVGPDVQDLELEWFGSRHLVGVPIYLQPIGDVNTHLKENIARCLKLLKKHPSWRLSAQLHKYLALR